MSKPTGESAFPNPGTWKLDKGMTLRDYFAAKVIDSFLDHSSTVDCAAKSAYEVADAMMKAREQ